MAASTSDFHLSAEEQERRISVFYDLMTRRVDDILLISSLYDYCIMEEDGRLAERIINEYRGLNLTRPPRITWVSSFSEAFDMLSIKTFQLLIVMPRMLQLDLDASIHEIKAQYPDLPILELRHLSPTPCEMDNASDICPGADRTYIWTGNTDLLIAQIKSVEDKMNVQDDTQTAGVRVILLVEDSAIYLSSLLPSLYRELVIQTQAAMEEGLNEEHRILTMRSRPKIIIAQTYQEALDVFTQYMPYLQAVISDVRFPRDNRLDPTAGVDLLRHIKELIPDLPLLLTSSESQNKIQADRIGAVFIDKNSPTLHAEIRSFLLLHLGFGDFIFRMPDGKEVARASNRLSLERILGEVPLESFSYHANRNDISRWFFARAENFLAQRLRAVSKTDFQGDMAQMRTQLQMNLAFQRRWRQKGVVVDYTAEGVDFDAEFLKIGLGSLGGKARGLAFIARLLKEDHHLYRKYPQINTIMPQTLVITTDVFETVTAQYGLNAYAKADAPNGEVAARFLTASLPSDILSKLRTFLSHVHYPLSLRSSGLLEDSRFQAYAGLYRTYMLPNDHPDLEERLRQLESAILLIFASTYYDGPKSFARRIGQRTEEEKMAVIIQKLIGNTHGDYFYPTLSAVAQSLNYYPFDKLQAEDGCVTIALGLGKTVVEGEGILRFSPRYPHIMPFFSRVEDILKYAQRSFYALQLGGGRQPVDDGEDPNLVRRQVVDALNEPPVQFAGSSYFPDENRIRDTGVGPGHRVITFADILKHKVLPLADLFSDILSLAQEGMGAPVELELALDPLTLNYPKPSLAILQARPMAATDQSGSKTITEEEIRHAFCFSTRALGNIIRHDLVDVVYVNSETFTSSLTVDAAAAIGRLNAILASEKRHYLLIGPGRWGSADPWLGIPVTWNDISAVGAIVETSFREIHADPSYGSHFFHNVTTLGVNYFTVSTSSDFLHMEQLSHLPVIHEQALIRHVRFPRPFLLKVDGRSSRGVIIAEDF